MTESSVPRLVAAIRDWAMVRAIPDLRIAYVHGPSREGHLVVWTPRWSEAVHESLELKEDIHAEIFRRFDSREDRRSVTG